MVVAPTEEVTTAEQHGVNVLLVHRRPPRRPQGAESSEAPLKAPNQWAGASWYIAGRGSSRTLPGTFVCPQHRPCPRHHSPIRRDFRGGAPAPGRPPPVQH